jgi:hypothetical protein
MKMKASLKLHIKKGRKNVFKKTYGLARVLKSVHLFAVILNLVCIATIGLLAMFTSEPLTAEVSASDADASVRISEKEVVSNGSEREIGKHDLAERYKVLAGPYYYSNVEPYLEIVDKVLTEKGLEEDSLFIQAMFFVGQHESHWQTTSVSGATYGGEHAVGMFQFLPSTFRSVSSGDIYNAEDQIRAYVTMAQRGRLKEFGTLYIGSLSPVVRNYALSF